MKKPVYKRLFAYAVDMLIVVIIASFFLDIRTINPYFDKYLELSESMMEYENGTTALTTETISKLQYDFVYYSFYSFIILLVVKVIYFIFFQFFNHGQTIGKALFKIQVVSEKRKLKFYQIALSSLIVCNIITGTINVICLRLLDVEKYTSVSSIISYFELLIVVINVIMITFRKDARGVHDLISNTSVVYKEKEK